MSLVQFGDILLVEGMEKRGGGEEMVGGEEIRIVVWWRGRGREGLMGIRYSVQSGEELKELQSPQCQYK